MIQQLPVQYVEPLFRPPSEARALIFRSDHVSNHMVLKGVLGKDKHRLLEQIDTSIAYFNHHPEFEHGNFDY